MKIIVILFIFCATFCFAQPYLKENGKTRHRFAQSVFGIDLESNFGGNTSFINSDGNLEQAQLSSGVVPRIYISGVHFWGHTEFYFSFQLKTFNSRTDGIVTQCARGDIFGTKVYPWPIQKKRIRPFFGTSLSYLMLKQNSYSGKGPVKYSTVFPVSVGINYCSGKYLLEAAFTYNARCNQQYYVSETQEAGISTPPAFISLGVRKWLETTVGSEKNYLNGETERRYKQHRKSKQLNSWFAGIGLSSAFYLNESDYNQQLYPFVPKPFSVIFPEISAGYFFESIKTHFAFAFRRHRKETESYSVNQTYTRNSLSVEAFIYLFDYHGFNPYFGIAGSIERLGFYHEQGSTKIVTERNFISPGIIAGWDILPDKLQGFVLRTNLRYFPLTMNELKSNKTIDFSQVEFNFIQVIFYPERMMVFRKNKIENN